MRRYYGLIKHSQRVTHGRGGGAEVEVKAIRVVILKQKQRKKKCREITTKTQEGR